MEYRHLPSLIENAKSYTTNPKYAEWQSGIISALPHLEESLTKLKSLGMSSLTFHLKEWTEIVQMDWKSGLIKVLPSQKSLLRRRISSTRCA